MAKYSGSIGSSAGDMITMLDTELVKHSNWSIYDASAGTNCKVYRCYNAALGVEWYLYADDNQSNYAKIRTWEAWDADAHSGSGKNTGQLYFLHNGGYYVIIVRATNMVYFSSGGSGARKGYYVGELIAPVEGAHHVVCLGHATTSPSISTAPITLTPYSSDIGWKVWRDIAGAYNQDINNCIFGASSPIGSTTRYIFDTSGFAHIQEEYMYCDDFCIGHLDGVMMTYLTLQGLGDGDLFDVDGVEWECYSPGGTYTVIVRNS